MFEPAKAAAVLYAKDLQRVVAFYRDVVGFAAQRAEDDFVLLDSPLLQLTVVAIPEHIATTFEIADPPQRREDTPIKLVLDVADLEGARQRAAQYGGVVDPPERAWRFGVHLVCDGHDPEGNVVQFRQRQQ